MIWRIYWFDQVRPGLHHFRPDRQITMTDGTFAGFPQTIPLDISKIYDLAQAVNARYVGIPFHFVHHRRRTQVDVNHAMLFLWPSRHIRHRRRSIFGSLAYDRPENSCNGEFALLLRHIKYIALQCHVPRHLSDDDRMAINQLQSIQTIFTVAFILCVRQPPDNWRSISAGKIERGEFMSVANFETIFGPIVLLLATCFATRLFPIILGGKLFPKACG